jgi:hypothetical protein
VALRASEEARPQASFICSPTKNVPTTLAASACKLCNGLGRGDQRAPRPFSLCLGMQPGDHLTVGMVTGSNFIRLSGSGRRQKRAASTLGSLALMARFGSPKLSDFSSAVPQLNIMSANEGFGSPFRGFVIIAVKVHPTRDMAIPAKQVSPIVAHAIPPIGGFAVHAESNRHLKIIHF